MDLAASIAQSRDYAGNVQISIEIVDGIFEFIICNYFY